MYAVTFDYTLAGAIHMRAFVCKDMDHVLIQINKVLRENPKYVLTGIFKKI